MLSIVVYGYGSGNENKRCSEMSLYYILYTTLPSLNYKIAKTLKMREDKNIIYKREREKERKTGRKGQLLSRYE